MRGALYGFGAAPQSMSVPKKGSVARYVRTFGPGSTTWICPRPGRYRFVANAGGGGGDGSVGGGGGSHSQKVRRCIRGEAVAISVAATVSGNSTGADTTVAFVDGSIVTAGGGANGSAGGAGGVATGGDINVNGSAASGPTGGAGASSGLFGAPAGRGGGGGGLGSPSSIGSLVVVFEG